MESYIFPVYVAMITDGKLSDGFFVENESLESIMSDSSVMPVSASILKVSDDKSEVSINFLVPYRYTVKVNFSIFGEDIYKFNSIFHDIDKLKEYVRNLDRVEWTKC